jgi:hypothetical protein
MAPSGGRDHLVALRKEVRCNGRSDQSIRPDHEHAHPRLLAGLIAVQQSRRR